MSKGFFITTEGVDGSGKTTQFRLMAEYLQDRGYDVVIAREPGGTKIGEKIRRIILDPVNTEMDPMAELLLYAAARAQLVSEVIAPSVKAGKIVMCDRFIDSSYVYQGYARGMGFEAVEEINRNAVRGYLPDITFFFDLSPEIAQERRSEREDDRIEQEKMDFHIKVFRGYKKIAERFPERIKVIDAGGTIEETFSLVIPWLNRVLPGID